MQAANTLTSLRICAGSPEHSVLDYMISTKLSWVCLRCWTDHWLWVWVMLFCFVLRARIYIRISCRPAHRELPSVSIILLFFQLVCPSACPSSFLGYLSPHFFDLIITTRFKPNFHILITFINLASVLPDERSSKWPPVGFHLWSL